MKYIDQQGEGVISKPHGRGVTHPSHGAGAQGVQRRCEPVRNTPPVASQIPNLSTGTGDRRRVGMNRPHLADPIDLASGHLQGARRCRGVFSVYYCKVARIARLHPSPPLALPWPFQSTFPSNPQPTALVPNYTLWPMMRCALLVASLALVHGQCPAPKTLAELAGSYIAKALGAEVGTAELKATGTLSVDLGGLGMIDGPWVTRPEPPPVLQAVWPGPRLADGPFPPSQGVLHWHRLCRNLLWPRHGHRNFRGCRGHANLRWRHYVERRLHDSYAPYCGRGDYQRRHRTDPRGIALLPFFRDCHPRRWHACAHRRTQGGIRLPIGPTILMTPCACLYAPLRPSVLHPALASDRCRFSGRCHPGGHRRRRPHDRHRLAPLDRQARGAGHLCHTDHRRGQDAHPHPRAPPARRRGVLLQPQEGKGGGQGRQGVDDQRRCPRDQEGRGDREGPPLARPHQRQLPRCKRLRVEPGPLACLATAR